MTSRPLFIPPSTQISTSSRKPAFNQVTVRQPDANLCWQANMAQRMSAGCAGAAGISSDGDDISARLRHTDRDDADARHHRQLYRHLGVRIGRLQFVDELSEVFDGIEIMIVARRYQTDAGRRAADGGDLFSHFVTRQVPAFARLGALPDLDFDVIRRIQKSRC